MMKKPDCGSKIADLTLTNRVALLLLATLTFLSPLEAGAVAFRLPNQDPDAIARGNAFAATADNPSAIYYNPAGITQLQDNNVRVGVYAVSPGYKYTSPSGSTTRAKSDFEPVPEIYYVFAPKDSHFAYGLGIYSPYGLGLDWGDNNPFRQLAINGKVLYACVNPVVAYKVTDTLSLAIGPTFNYSQAQFKRGLGFVPGDSFEFKGDGYDTGFNAGLRWQPIKQLSFGLNYRHQTEVNYHGYATISPSFLGVPNADTHGKLKYPQFIVGGVSYRPTEKWNLEVDVDWTDWNSVNNLTFENVPGGGNQTLPLNYTDSFMYEFGVTRQLPRNYHVSVGYFYSENTSPNLNFNPIIPDANLQLGSIGFGHQGKRWDWSAAYHFGYNGGRTVQGSQPGLADGTYKTFNQAFNIAVGCKF